MKKITAWILSMTLIFSAGGVTALASTVEESLTAGTFGVSEEEESAQDDLADAFADQADGETDDAASLSESETDESAQSSDAGQSESDAGRSEKDAGQSESDAEWSDSNAGQLESAAAGDSSDEDFGTEAAPDTLQSESDDVDWVSAELTIRYDDYYSVTEILEESEFAAGESENAGDTDYIIYQIQSDQDSITSYQVSGGAVTEEKDAAVVALEDDSDTELVAVGVGTATVYLVPEEQADGGGITTGIAVAVTVEPATLTLMLLAGQSNMEGYCSSATGYEPETSIACEEGTVYSTYAPTSASKAKNVAGITITDSQVVSTTNYSSTAEDCVAGSLQGETGISGETLAYPLNSLTTEGNGKTGPDSGLAYEWNQLTGEKVWVVNAAWGGSSIKNWVSGATYYDRAKAVFSAAIQTYQAELAAGHYTAGSTLVYWLQGETTDKTMKAATYESYFSSMYASMESDFAPTAIGIIMVRASTGSYTDSDELEMTGPRIAQYAFGASGDYSNVYVVSNVNEEWISDSGVESYFSEEYSSGILSYPTHESSGVSIPTTMSEIHSDIHYSQIGHNENGITAAEGMYTALVADGIYDNDSSVNTAVTGLSWKNEDGESISSLTIAYQGGTKVVVPVASPVYLAKKVSLSWTEQIPESGQGDVISYDSMTCEVSALVPGEATITAEKTGGSRITWLNVIVLHSADLTDVVGSDYTGIYEDDGRYWYLVNGIIQMDYYGVAEASSCLWYVTGGTVDTSYTGFLEYEEDWWYFENGQATGSVNSVIQDKNSDGESVIDGNFSWWYVVGSKVQQDFTGLADYANANGWWYIEDGKVTFTKNTVAKNANGWWYVTGSKVDFSYNGFASNSNGWWYIENGKVTFSKNSVVNGTVDGTTAWWYVVGSKVQQDFTGLADYANANGWWYIEDGKVTFTKNTVAKNKNGWYYVKNSKVIFSYNGFASNSNGWWYIENGKVTFSKNSVIKGTVNGTTAWWYVVGSKVQQDFTGLANYSNANGWWYIKGGKVDFSFAGIAENQNGIWYLQNGKVNFNYSGTVRYRGVLYQVKNGKVA